MSKEYYHYWILKNAHGEVIATESIGKSPYKTKDVTTEVIEYEAIKPLLEALESISKDFGTDYCDGHCVIAKEALDVLKGAINKSKG